MRVSLVKNGKIYNTNLPTRISGSFWIEDKDKNNNKRNLINIESRNGQWILKSNFETKIVYNNSLYEELPLEEFICIELKVKGENFNYILFTTPVYDKNSVELEVGSNAEVYIGKDSNDTICYENTYIANKQCVISNKQGVWYVKNLTNVGVVFVNDSAILESKLEVGDIVHIMCLKVIICGSYIIINNPKGLKGYNTAILTVRKPLKLIDENTQFEEDTEIKAYDQNEYFFRMPRFRTLAEEKEISIDPPPEQEHVDDTPLAYTLGPMITMGITSMVTGVTSISGVIGGTQSLTSALPSLITCGAMLVSMIFWPMLQKNYQDRQRKKREQSRIKKYNEYIEERRNYIKNEVSQQRQALIEGNIPLNECVQIITNRKRNLWERKIEHDDFLQLRLGIGNVEPYVKVSYPEEHFTLTENNLRDVLEKLGEETKIMQDVPVNVNLTEKYILAITGKTNVTKSFIDGLILKIMTFHSYEDLKIVIMTSKENESRWKYLKKSPYLLNDDKSIRFFSTNVDEANQLSIYLNNYYENRKYEDGDVTRLRNQNYTNYSPYYLIITDDYQSIRNVEIVKNVLNQNMNLGFSFLIVQDRLLGLPNECTTFMNIDTNESVLFGNELTKNKQQIFKADFINEINIETISKIVANIPIEMTSDRYSLPDKLGFLEMYGVGKIEQLNILNRWKVNNPITSLSAPIGIDTNGELFKLDLHEKFHGPHGLIAGMTGSGKSEFIITYILSMAINYNPEEVSFVLIDYKGGGLAGAFENKETGVHIPHLSGTITNLDINDMKRSLASINSELKRRQAIFNDARQKLNESTIDIYKYQKLKREGKVQEPIPHLFIISDEFAELKSQQPEFMDQLISTARIGRSLGVHLILATQKPNGVVDDQIWSNTKFRVCLKVQDKADSIDMIKCADAAALHNVGRFYLQVGYNEYFALGQSAYAGVNYLNTDKIKRKIDTNIDFINNVGYKTKIIDVEETNVETIKYGEELKNIVKYLYDLGVDENKFSQKLWLDKIPAKIYVHDLEKKYNYQSQRFLINPVIGEYDDPDHQSQSLLQLPLSEEGNTIIYGSTGTGKEDLIRTIIYSVSMRHTPEEVNFYVLDFGAESLKLWDEIPTVGDVLLSSDTEKINNLLKMLKEEIDNRKKLFQDFGGSYEQYIKSSGKFLPTIIVIINIYEAFEEIYPEFEDTINSLTREGSKYGVIFILTTSGVNFIRYKLKQNFKQHLALQLNDESDYSDIVGNTHGLIPSKIKGRGLIKFKNVYEFQSASINSSDDLSQFIDTLAAQLKHNYSSHAPKVPILPKLINYEVVKDKINGIDNIPVGIEKTSLNVSTFDFRSKPVTIISSSDSNAFESFVPEFIKVCTHTNAQVTVLDAEKMFENEKFNCTYVKESFDTVFDKLYNYLEMLNKTYINSNYNENSISNAKDVLILIVGISQLRNKLSDENKEKIEQFMLFVKNIRKVSVALIDTIDNIKEFEYENWYKTVVSDNYAIWLGDGISDQFTIKLSKNPKYIREEIGNSYGYCIKKGSPILIKILSDSDIVEEDDYV